MQYAQASILSAAGRTLACTKTGRLSFIYEQINSLSGFSSTNRCVFSARQRSADVLGRDFAQFPMADTPQQIFAAVADKAHIQYFVTVEKFCIQFRRPRIHFIPVPPETAPTVDNAIAGNDHIRFDHKSDSAPN